MKVHANIKHHKAMAKVKESLLIVTKINIFFLICCVFPLFLLFRTLL